MKDKIYVYKCNNCNSATMNFYGGNCMNCFQPMQVLIYVPEAALAAAEQRGYEQAREQAAMIASGYEFAPGMGVRERIENIVNKIRALRPATEAGE